MKCPSVATLVSTFRDLTTEQAGLIKRICRAVEECDGERLEAIIRAEVPDSLMSCDFAGRIATAGRGWRRTYALRAVDHILGTHGVESLNIPDEFSLNGPPYEYLNAGDTYATTLVYFRDSDALRIDCWGDVVERMERRGVRFE